MNQVEKSEKICWIKSKNYSYLKDTNDEDKKANGRKNCVIKRKIELKDYKKCLKASPKINYLEKKKI